MSTEAFQMALNTLSIQRILLRSSEVISNDAYEIGFFEGKFENQLRTKVLKYLRLKGEADNGSTISVVRYVIEFGARTVEPQDESESSSKVDAVKTIFETICRFNVDFSASEELSDESLSSFAKNAVHNAWPYWREYIQSTCARAGLPNIEVPPFVLPKPL